MTDERDNDQRPSWREIDQRRDRPQRREGVPKRRAKTQAEWLRKLSLRQAEALFKGKQGQPEYQVALRNLEKAHGTKKFTQAAKKFLEEYGFPEEWGTMNLLLDCTNPEVVGQVLQVMAQQAGGRSRVEQQGFKGRLQILTLTNPSVELRHLAQALLTKYFPQ